MTVSFNDIPVDIRTPGQYLEIDNTNAIQGLVTRSHKVLVVGQRFIAGTVSELEPTMITAGSQGDGFFGRGSMLSAMLTAFKKANATTEVHAIALDENDAGTAAAGSIAFAGPAAEAGTVNVYIAGHRVQVGVSKADSADDIATALAAAINANPDLPVTAAVNGTTASQVDITCRWKGETGNAIDLRVNYYAGEALPTDVAATIVAMTGGASNPDIADAISTIGDERFDTIVMPFTDAANLTALETELTRRWGPMVQREGHAFAATTGTHSEGVTLGDSRNSPHVTIMPAQKSPSPTWALASVTAALDAGEPDPARPRQTLAMPGILPPAVGDRYTREERNLHLQNGLSTLVVDDGGVVRIERLITTYQTNVLGIPDISYLDVTTLRTVAYLRFTVRARIALRYPRHKLADDGTRYGSGQAIVTPSVIRAELISLFTEWEDAGLAENMEQFKRDLLVERSSTDPNRMDAVIPPDVINQFRVFAGSVKFIL